MFKGNHFRVNPYRPGAGLMPVYLAGRDDDIESVELMLEALKMNIPTQSIIFSGAYVKIGLNQEKPYKTRV